MNKSVASPATLSAVDVAAPVAFPLPQALPAAVNDGQWRRVPRMLRAAAARVSGIASSLRSLGPYLAIEVLLPGGSIVALALWAYRRRAARRDAETTPVASAPVAAPRPQLRCVARCGSR